MINHQQPMNFTDELDLYSNKALTKIFQSKMSDSDNSYWISLMLLFTKPEKCKSLSSKNLRINLQKINTFADFVETISLDGYSQTKMCQMANISKHMWLLAEQHKNNPSIHNDCIRLYGRFVHVLDIKGGFYKLVDTVITELNMPFSPANIPFELESALKFIHSSIHINFKDLPNTSYLEDIRELRSIKIEHLNKKDVTTQFMSMVPLYIYNKHIQPLLNSDKTDALERHTAACLEVFLKYPCIPADTTSRCMLMSLIATVDTYLDRVLDSEYVIYDTNPRELYASLKNELGELLYGDSFDRIWHTGKTLNCLDKMDYLKASVHTENKEYEINSDMPLF